MFSKLNLRDSVNRLYVQGYFSFPLSVLRVAQSTIWSTELISISILQAPVEEKQRKTRRLFYLLAMRKLQILHARLRACRSSPNQYFYSKRFMPSPLRLCGHMNSSCYFFSEWQSPFFHYIRAQSTFWWYKSAAIFFVISDYNHIFQETTVQ